MSDRLRAANGGAQVARWLSTPYSTRASASPPPRTRNLRVGGTFLVRLSPFRPDHEEPSRPRLALRASLWSVSRDPARRAGAYDTCNRLRAPARPTSPLLPSTTRRSLRLPWRSPTGAERNLQSERRGVEGRREHVGRAGARRRPIVSHAPAWRVKAREVDRRSDRSANRGGEGHCWSGRKGGETRGGTTRTKSASMGYEERSRARDANGMYEKPRSRAGRRSTRYFSPAPASSVGR